MTGYAGGSSGHRPDESGIPAPGKATGNFETVSIAGAGAWIMVFNPDLPPRTVKVMTGDTVRHDSAPIGRIQAPNTV